MGMRRLPQSRNLLLLLPGAMAPPPLRTAVTWIYRFRLQGESHTARRNLYIDELQRFSTHRAMQSGMSAGAVRAVHCCRVLVARSGVIGGRRLLTVEGRRSLRDHLCSKMLLRRPQERRRDRLM